MMAEKLSPGAGGAGGACADGAEDDFLFEARVILDVAERCAAQSPTHPMHPMHPIEPRFVDVIIRELDFVNRHCRALYTTHAYDTVPFSLRTRTEYLLLVVNSIIQRVS
jgi:hypothetical protein